MKVPIGIKKAAVLSILKYENNYLLLRRTKEPHLGKYIPIGGRIEPFETPRDAALRETKEETGISLLKIKLMGLMTETSPTKFNWINYIYSSEISHSTPKECAEGVLEWIPKERLKKIPTPTTDLYIYDYVSNGNFFVLDAIYDEKKELLSLVDEITGTILYKID